MYPNPLPVFSTFRKDFVTGFMALLYKPCNPSCSLPSEYPSHRSCQNDFLIKQHSFRKTLYQISTYYAWYHYAR